MRRRVVALLPFLWCSLIASVDTPAAGGDCKSLVCVIAALPKIGHIDRKSCLPAKEYRLSPMPGVSFVAKEASVRGVFYRIGTDDTGRVKYIVTNDTCFKTEEGVAVGTTLSAIRREFPKASVQTEAGWARFIRLPSGWNAAFAGSEKGVEDLAPEATVKWFFQR